MQQCIETLDELIDRLERPAYLDGEVVDAVHVQILNDFQILHFRFVATQALVVSVPGTRDEQYSQ